MLKHIDVPFQIKAVSENGLFSGYGSVFGVIDSYKEIVVAGAFTESLQAKTPSLLWQHRSGEPIGIYTSVKEDAIGLHVEGKLALKTARGAEAYELLQMGAISGMSIGYQVRDESYDRVTGINTLKKLDLWEVSLVTFPANDAARVTDVKGAMTERDFERLMQDAGLSRKEARMVMNHGFRSLKAMQDAGDTELSEITALMQRGLSLIPTL